MKLRPTERFAKDYDRLPQRLQHRVDKGRELWRVAWRKLEQLDSVERIEELRVPPGNRLEALAGDRKGQFSVRVNERFRICFRWTDEGPVDVEIVDYH